MLMVAVEAFIPYLALWQNERCTKSLNWIEVKQSGKRKARRDSAVCAVTPKIWSKPNVAITGFVMMKISM